MARQPGGAGFGLGLIDILLTDTHPGEVDEHLRSTAAAAHAEGVQGLAQRPFRGFGAAQLSITSTGHGQQAGVVELVHPGRILFPSCLPDGGFGPAKRGRTRLLVADGLARESLAIAVETGSMVGIRRVQHFRPELVPWTSDPSVRMLDEQLDGAW